MDVVEEAVCGGAPAGSQFRDQVHGILAGSESRGRLGRAVTAGLTVLIVLNVVAAALETVQALQFRWARAFAAFEAFSVAVFAVEYLLRLWSCGVDPRYEGPIAGRVRCAVTPLMLIDLVAIAPFFLTSVMTVDLRMLRAIRLLRLLRVLKIARYSESLQLLGRVLLAKRGELVVTLAGVLVLLVVSAMLMYYAEHEAQPEMFANVPAAMWWAVETLTTIGYGDMLPVTVLGKIINSVIALLGIGLFALPAGILGSGFVEELQRKRQGLHHCPFCGQSLPKGGNSDARDWSADE